MLFKLNEKDFTTYYKDGVHYLYADTTMFGDKLRLGDFVMYSTLLFSVKQYLINRSPKLFNQNNLYFILNRIGGLMIGDLNSTLALFPDVWRGHSIEKNGRTNVRQVINGGNIWSFKMYLTENNIKLSDKQFNNRHVVDPRNFNLTGNIKDTIYIFPTRAKVYNTERNMSDRDIINIIRKLKRDDKLVLITKDNNINANVIRSGANRVMEVLDGKVSWLEIMLSIMSDCKLFISGDCGLSHLVSMIHKDYKPAMEIYYRTKEFIMRNPLNKFDEAVTNINFIPYKPYLTDNMVVKKF